MGDGYGDKPLTTDTETSDNSHKPRNAAVARGWKRKEMNAPLEPSGEI